MADELFQSSKTNLWGFGVGIKPPLARRSPAGVLCLCWLFQSRDWVDVYSGSAPRRPHLESAKSFNPATGLMLIPARCILHLVVDMSRFQSLDWVDVYSGEMSYGDVLDSVEFQSLDWVDVYSGSGRGG